MRALLALTYFILSFQVFGATTYTYNGTIKATAFIGDGSGLTGIAGGGDVDGPVSSVDSRIAAFDGTTGKILKDGGILVTNIPSKITSNIFTATQTVSLADSTAAIWARSDGVLDGTGQELRLLLGTGGGSTSGTLLGHYSLSGGVSTAKNFFRMYDTGMRMDDASSNPMLDVNFSTDTVGIGAAAGSEQFNGKLFIGGTFNTGATNNVRGVLVAPTVTLGSGWATAMYDAAGITNGTANIDHIVAYQARAIHDSDGTIADLSGFSSIMVNNGGLATNAYGFLVFDVTGTGTVTNNYGLYVRELTKGTNDWAVYTAGATPSYFGGLVTSNVGFSGVGTNLTALNASNLGSGTVPTGRLGSGTADSTTFLRGDGTWATASGGGGSGTKTIARFRALEAELPASNYAGQVIRNRRPVMTFDTTTQETIYWTDVVPEGSVLTSGVTVYVHWTADTATSGTVGWDVSFERTEPDGSLDLDSDNFGTAQTITAVTVPATAGQLKRTSVTFSQAQLPSGLAAGDMYRVRVRRDVANDTASGDAMLHFVEIRTAN